MGFRPLERIRQTSLGNLSSSLASLASLDHPIVLSGAALTWPAISTLRLTELKAHFGNAKIPIRDTDNELELFFGTGTSGVEARRMMDLRTYIDIIQRAQETDKPRPPYAGNISILNDPAVAQKLTAILRGCHFPGSFPDAKEEYRLWIGASGQRSSIHNDPYNNFNAQIYGRKCFIVYPPNQHDLLYPVFFHVGLWASQVDPTTPDLSRFPKFSEAEGFECELTEGDILYLPRFWWHSAYAKTACVNVNRWVSPGSKENSWWHQQEAARPWISYEALLASTRRRFESLPPDMKEFRRAEYTELEADLSRFLH